MRTLNLEEHMERYRTPAEAANYTIELLEKLLEYHKRIAIALETINHYGIKQDS